jgi:hypothetical protein
VVFHRRGDDYWGEHWGGHVLGGVILGGEVVVGHGGGGDRVGYGVVEVGYRVCGGGDPLGERADDHLNVLSDVIVRCGGPLGQLRGACRGGWWR